MNRYFLVLLAGCTSTQPQKQTGAMLVDVAPLRQALAQTSLGELDSIGLLVVRGTLATVAEEMRKLDTDAGSAERETTTTQPLTDTQVLVDGDLLPATTPARAAAPATVPGTLAAPKVSDTVAADETSPDTVAGSTYYPITLDAGADTFSIELPAGRAQNIFLIGYAKAATAEGKPTPVYVAASLGVTLKAREKMSVLFAAYPAGIALPQFWPPTTVGLRDVAGHPITSLPNMSCLAVATAMSGRPEFPRESLSRVNIGSLNAQLQAVGAAGLFILPTGHYKMDCTAAFAGKVFGVDPKKPLEFDVAQGQVALPTAGLVKLRDNVTIPPGTGPGGGNNPSVPVPPAPLNPRYRVHVAQGAAIARAAPGGTGTEIFALNEANFHTLSDGDLRVQAVNDDGTPRSGSDHVIIEMRPAYQAGKWGTDIAGGVWVPFDHGFLPPDAMFETYLEGGEVTLTNVLRFTQLDLSSPVQYLITVRSFDSDNVMLRRSGARYITVGTEGACLAATVDHAEVFTLSDETNVLTLDIKPDRTSAREAVNLLLVGVSRATRCAVALSANTGPELTFDPKNEAFVALQFSSAFSPVLETYKAALPAYGDSQDVYWDAIAPSSSLASQRPLIGQTLLYMVHTFITAAPDMSLNVWNLQVNVRAAP